MYSSRLQSSASVVDSTVPDGNAYATARPRVLSVVGGLDDDEELPAGRTASAKGGIPWDQLLLVAGQSQRPSSHSVQGKGVLRPAPAPPVQQPLSGVTRALRRTSPAFASATASSREREEQCRLTHMRQAVAPAPSPAARCALSDSFYASRTRKSLDLTQGPYFTSLFEPSPSSPDVSALARPDLSTYRFAALVAGDRETAEAATPRGRRQPRREHSSGQDTAATSSSLYAGSTASSAVLPLAWDDAQRRREDSRRELARRRRSSSAAAQYYASAVAQPYLAPVTPHAQHGAGPNHAIAAPVDKDRSLRQVRDAAPSLSAQSGGASSSFLTSRLVQERCAELPQHTPPRDSPADTPGRSGSAHSSGLGSPDSMRSYALSGATSDAPGRGRARAREGRRERLRVRQRYALRSVDSHDRPSERSGGVVTPPNSRPASPAPSVNAFIASYRAASSIDGGRAARRDSSAETDARSRRSGSAASRRSASACSSRHTGRPLYPHLTEQRRLHTTGLAKTDDDGAALSAAAAAAHHPPAALRRTAQWLVRLVEDATRQVAVQQEQQQDDQQQRQRRRAGSPRARGRTGRRGVPVDGTSVAELFTSFLVFRYGALRWRPVLEETATALQQFHELCPLIYIFRQYFGGRTEMPPRAGVSDGVDGTQQQQQRQRQEDEEQAEKDLTAFRLFCVFKELGQRDSFVVKTRVAYTPMRSANAPAAAEATIVSRRYFSLHSLGAVLDTVLRAVRVPEVLVVADDEPTPEGRHSGDGDDGAAAQQRRRGFLVYPSASSPGRVDSEVRSTDSVFAPLTTESVVVRRSRQLRESEVQWLTDTVMEWVEEGYTAQGNGGGDARERHGSRATASGQHGAFDRVGCVDADALSQVLVEALQLVCCLHVSDAERQRAPREGQRATGYSRSRTASTHEADGRGQSPQGSLPARARATSKRDVASSSARARRRSRAHEDRGGEPGAAITISMDSDGSDGERAASLDEHADAAASFSQDDDRESPQSSWNDVPKLPRRGQYADPERFNAMVRQSRSELHKRAEIQPVAPGAPFSSSPSSQRVHERKAHRGDNSRAATDSGATPSPSPIRHGPDHVSSSLASSVHSAGERESVCEPSTPIRRSSTPPPSALKRELDGRHGAALTSRWRTTASETASEEAEDSMTARSDGSSASAPVPRGSGSDARVSAAPQPPRDPSARSRGPRRTKHSASSDDDADTVSAHARESGRRPPATAPLTAESLKKDEETAMAELDEVLRKLRERRAKFAAPEAP